MPWQSGQLPMPIRYCGGPTTVPLPRGFVSFVHSQDYTLAWAAPGLEDKAVQLFGSFSAPV